ncbi:hypothetical protein like AT2G03810 [Hibiscus trionum]|uniref:18S pre-ribosomal assembly protein gar2-related n=1 Tax=Hibiscus trionum TaxID=183268 RepID=A0A9W7LSB7_HIBTR|nr:hypothetical protein like AT2G03810 [Hibiscus trionum]
MKGDQNGLMHEKMGTDGDSDPAPCQEKTGNGWPEPKLDCYMSVNDFANGNEKEVGDFVTCNSRSLKNMDSFQDSVFYMDKSVMECALPELVVCYRESTYHVVKDICIDEGVPTQDKFLFDSGVDEKSNSHFLPSESDQDSKLLKEKSESDISKEVGSMPPEENQTDDDIDNDCGSNKNLHADICTQDVSLSLEENEPNKGNPCQSDSKDLILTREMKDDTMKIITDDVPKEVFTLGELLSMPELSTLNSKAMASDYRSNGIEQQCFENSREKEVTVTPPLVSADKELNNSGKETSLSAAASGSVAEELDSGKGEATRFSSGEESTSNGLVSEVCDDNKLAAQNIACGSDSSAPTNGKDEGCHNLDREPPETGGTPKLEGTTDLPLSNNLLHGFGESSFSAAGQVTGLISYSGPIAYSGSLSLRSDSSTTSTRSFAFPILQSEWNSSPVRMAKADRRHYRKHRGWRQGLLCCRF